MHNLINRLDLFGPGSAAVEFENLIKQKQKFMDRAGGNILKFSNIVEKIECNGRCSADLTKKAVTLTCEPEPGPEELKVLEKRLMQLGPWRKGPFDICGIYIDSEWQSWMKWDRIAPHIGRVEGRRILDIGSSNGYYMFRLAAGNPLMVLGLEPQPSFYFQYCAIRRFLDFPNVFCLPITHDELPETAGYFDLVLCMGVLYHRKSPVSMLKKIFRSMRPGGKLVLENLIIESRQNLCLFPRDRYAKMRNVFFIPDFLAMESWLVRSGFTSIKCVDVKKTDLKEQRKTRWIQTESLEDFLDPDNPDRTVEGYPAPVRAVFTAIKK